MAAELPADKDGVLKSGYAITVMTRSGRYRTYPIAMPSIKPGTMIYHTSFGNIQIGQITGFSVDERDVVFWDLKKYSGAHTMAKRQTEGTETLEEMEMLMKGRGAVIYERPAAS